MNPKAPVVFRATQKIKPMTQRLERIARFQVRIIPVEAVLRAPQSLVI
jgi:hypothetical protein